MSTRPQTVGLPTATIIIPTYNRPDDLGKALASILTQSHFPEEVIVVDDGELPGFPLREEFERRGMRCQFIKKDKPGLTESRNAGVAASSGEIILFLDDDVVLESEYVQEILKAFAADTDKRVGGVGGYVTNYPHLTFARKIRWWYDRLFLLSGAHEGRVLPSGFCVDYHTTSTFLTEVTPVDFLPGCACAYRREVFDEIQFTPGLHDYALDEDKDFSYRVALRWTLLSVPSARQEHYQSKTMRPQLRNVTRRYLIGRYLFFRKYVCKGLGHWFCWWYAVFGYVFYRLAMFFCLCRPGQRQRLLGALDAVRLILVGGIEK